MLSIPPSIFMATSYWYTRECMINSSPDSFIYSSGSHTVHSLYIYKWGVIYYTSLQHRTIILFEYIGMYLRYVYSYQQGDLFSYLLHQWFVLWTSNGHVYTFIKCVYIIRFYWFVYLIQFTILRGNNTVSASLYT